MNVRRHNSIIYRSGLIATTNANLIPGCPPSSGRPEGSSPMQGIYNFIVDAAYLLRRCVGATLLSRYGGRDLRRAV